MESDDVECRLAPLAQPTMSQSDHEPKAPRKLKECTKPEELEQSKECEKIKRPLLMTTLSASPWSIGIKQLSTEMSEMSTGIF